MEVRNQNVAEINQVEGNTAKGKAIKEKKEKLNLSDQLGEFVDYEDFANMWDLSCSRNITEFTVFHRLGGSFLQLEITFCGVQIYVAFGWNGDNPEVITSDDLDEAWEKFSTLTLGEVLECCPEKDYKWLLGSYFNEEKEKED